MLRLVLSDGGAVVASPLVAELKAVTRSTTIYKAPTPFPASLEQSGVTVPCQRHDLLWQAHDPHDWWCRIIDGAAATCALMTDGRRHVIEFLFPGDLFGVQALPFAELRTEAISSPTIYVRYPRQHIERAADNDPLVAREIREATLQTIMRLRAQAVVLGRATALEKIAAFLLEMTTRARPCSGSSFVLPMSRYDIADHLGMAVETVSRVLSELRSRGTISLRAGRTVQILKRSTLEQLIAGGAPWTHDSGRGPAAPLEMPVRNYGESTISIRENGYPSSPKLWHHVESGGFPENS